jgi:hypothetical protein
VEAAHAYGWNSRKPETTKNTATPTSSLASVAENGPYTERPVWNAACVATTAVAPSARNASRQGKSIRPPRAAALAPVLSAGTVPVMATIVRRCPLQTAGSGLPTVISFVHKVTLGSSRVSSTALPPPSRSRKYWCLPGSTGSVCAAPPNRNVASVSPEAT